MEVVCRLALTLFPLQGAVEPQRAVPMVQVQRLSGADLVAFVTLDERGKLGLRAGFSLVDGGVGCREWFRDANDCGIERVEVTGRAGDFGREPEGSFIACESQPSCRREWWREHNRWQIIPWICW